jgi:2-isopropylmalate synthase
MSSQLPDIRGLLETHVSESLPIRPGLAVRTKQEDVETVARLRDEFPAARLLRANAFLGASRLRHWVQGWSWGEQRDNACRVIEWGARRGIPIMFVTEDTTRTRPEDLDELYLAAVQAGAEEVCIADTCGHALPWGTIAIVRHLRQLLDTHGHQGVLVNWHGHSDRGMALINCLAAMEGGAGVVHGTILGIGERCGNAQLDQLLVNLYLLGLWGHSISPLKDYVDLVSRCTGIAIPPLYPCFGPDAFRTATGIHADAIAKAERLGDRTFADLVYSSVPASMIGRRQEIEIGPMSGHSNVRAWLKARGLSADDESVERLLDRAKRADAVLTDEQVQETLTDIGR